MKKVLVMILAAATLVGCEGYFGNKTDLSFIDVPTYSVRDIAYVPIQPAFGGFVHPSDLCIGYDELLYVVDEATEEIICLNESGAEQGRITIPGVQSVRQDRQLDLLAIGSYDTLVNGVNYSLACLYRIRQIGPGGQYGLPFAQVIHKTIHPFYFKNTFSASDALVRFGQVAILANSDADKNNRYYVTRTGPSSNNANQGPDDAVILFSHDDVYISPLSISTSSGLFTNYFQDPRGIVSFAQPPQYTAAAGDDFWFTSQDPDQALQVQHISFIETEFGADYRPVIYAGNSGLADRSINMANRFTDPCALTMAGDNTRYLFIVDRERDSVYQFTASGLEGIPPPPASGETRYTQVSFGGEGEGPMQFIEPCAVAHWKKILYVVDAGNGRISRFKCTLDFE
ncbi:hypothetical protein N9N00_03645 [Schleiferiaceae bacterium]|jgi:hypothetical protein|nr:hypothetical protein [Schleiferiaceae bacterium]MDA9151615.1 hypothetical protein [Schleiferiaceae bacterium]